MIDSCNPSGQYFPRAAGVAVPLFSLCGAHDLGGGEILDLIPFIEWLARWHQRVVQLLPINEAAPDQTSPYTTLSAFAIDPGYISATRVVDVVESAAAQAWLRTAQVRRKVSRVAGAPRRERQAGLALKLRLLEFGFAEFEAHGVADERAARFAAFCQHNGWWIDDYALFRALKERRRWRNWETWPEDLRAHDPRALARAAEKLRPRVRFAQYLQWIAAEQWNAVRAHAQACGVWLNGDLPFVCGPDSADVWAHRQLFDSSSSAGAPPDAFSKTGQKWGLPLYDWAEMRRSDYAWWRQRARQARQLYDVFRVDHVVGLYRTYAIPLGAGGTAGFVPHEQHSQLAQGHALLSAILEEAAPAAVIAEDLGTVPDWVRESLTQLGIPGYKVFRWEAHDGRYIDPRTYPPLSVTTTGTHDTDTLAQWWPELHTDDRTAIATLLDLDPTRVTDHASLPLDVLLRRLYEAGSALTVVPIQDLFGWPERINTPATVNTDNWTYRLPVAIDQLDEVPAIRARMETIREMIDASGRDARKGVLETQRT